MMLKSSIKKEESISFRENSVDTIEEIGRRTDLSTSVLYAVSHISSTMKQKLESVKNL
jgi:hypothetical protein